MLDWPLFRSSITPSTTTTTTTNSNNGTNAKPKATLTVRPHADISIALSTPTGLYTPTLTRTDTLSTYALASHLTHFSSLGRRTPCALGPREMPKSGGTLTLSAPVTPGQSISFTFAVTLSSSAGNTYQGLTASQPLVWTFTS